MCVRVLTVIRAAVVCVDSVRNAASVVSGSVLLSLDVCGRAPETSSPSSVTLSFHCASVNTGSQVSSIPAGYPGSRGNGSSQSIGNRAKSHFASGWKLTVVQLVCVNVVESCWGVTSLCSHRIHLHRWQNRRALQLPGGCSPAQASLAACLHAGPEAWLSFNAAGSWCWVADAF